MWPDFLSFFGVDAEGTEPGKDKEGEGCNIPVIFVEDKLIILTVHNGPDGC